MSGHTCKSIKNMPESVKYDDIYILKLISIPPTSRKCVHAWLRDFSKHKWPMYASVMHRLPDLSTWYLWWKISVSKSVYNKHVIVYTCTHTRPQPLTDSSVQLQVVQEWEMKKDTKGRGIKTTAERESSSLPLFMWTGVYVLTCEWWDLMQNI